MKTNKEKREIVESLKGILKQHPTHPKRAVYERMIKNMEEELG